MVSLLRARLMSHHSHNLNNSIQSWLLDFKNYCLYIKSTYIVGVREHEVYLHQAIFRHLEFRHGKEWVRKLLLGTAEWGKRRGRRAVAVPQQAAESSAGTVLEIDSDELHEFLHLEELKSSAKMIFWCQMIRRGTGLLGLINLKGGFSTLLLLLT